MVSGSRMIQKAYLYWSIAQAFVALTVTALGITALTLDCKFSDSAVPLWSGAWFFLCGLLGISASRNTNNNCLTGGHLVFCVIGIMYSINMTVLFSTAAAEEEETTDSESPLAARAAVDITLATLGIVQVFLSVRCLAFASKVCCSGNNLAPRRNSRPNTENPREIEVAGMNIDVDVPQTPSTVMAPPSYAYVNSTAPQSYDIRFANGNFPPVPPYADQPPSYSEVTSSAWTPNSLQIQISYTPTSEERQEHTAVSIAADSQARESENGQSPQVTTTVSVDQATDTPSARSTHQKAQNGVVAVVEVEPSTPNICDTHIGELLREDGQSSQ